VYESRHVASGIISGRGLGHVISDLHLFARRSVAERYAGDIGHAAAESEFFVLNGDIFDFRWSTLPTVEDSVDAAVAWLRDLVEGHPRCRFYYTVGNHDNFAPFVDRLDALAASVANLEWHPSHVRLGTAFFLHGDLPLAWRRSRRSVRTFHTSLGGNGRTRRVLYRGFVACRGHRVVASLHQPRPCVKRITRWLHADAGRLADGVTDVYFGHTHRDFADYEYGGLRFHNTGSSIRGLRSRMLAVRAS
jgi:UDP-2,3-diacylglucosamine hydrolase